MYLPGQVTHSDSKIPALADGTAALRRAAVLSSTSGRHYIDLLDAGAGKFDPDIVTAIVATAQGRTVPPRAATASANPLLSPRELDVLRQISAGLSNKEAARALALSPSTVRTHVESIFRKLDCSTRAAATLKALTAGML
ncbi:phosphohydrolase [Pandoraea capi]|uniref:Phosphohydrolase n=1 Tax=Pandoraea capi TaxID=2508286 RepID=A0ABY6VQI9_9BURK|nr:phosphohydrolase [Pandoraea capi]